MALTQPQWYAKLRSFVPSWWWEQEQYNVALFQAIAQVLAQVDQDGLDQFNATFLTKSTSPVLDAMGDERSRTRLTGETDTGYAVRIQQIASTPDKTSIRLNIDSMLVQKGCVIQEAPGDSPYCSRSAYLSRDQYGCSFINDFFTVILPKQTHDAYSFCSRGQYGSRTDFIGTSDAVTALYPSIVGVINAMKAFGVMYRVIESTRTKLF